jgi:uncharacterized protein
MIKTLYALALVLALTPSVSVAQSYFTGAQAYETGDYATALKEWRPLAEQGYANAQNSIGYMYEYGNGVAQDYAEAVKWYRLAAEQGQAIAQRNLAIMYGNGRGVVQDYVSAHMWSNIATANGNESARETRDRVSGRMTTDDISEAQRRARVCMASNFQDCD